MRLLLALPALIVSARSAAGGGVRATREQLGQRRGASRRRLARRRLAFLGWFASLVTGRMPRASATPAPTRRLPGPGTRLPPARHRPVPERRPDRDARRARAAAACTRCTSSATPRTCAGRALTVFFRLPLAIPHLVWLVLWASLAVLASIVQWLVTLIRGRPVAAAAPVPLALRALRASTSTPSSASSRTRSPASPARRAPTRSTSCCPQPGRQNRWKTGFRALLAIPALRRQRRARRRARRRRGPDLVRRARRRARRRGAPQPLRLRAPLHGADERLLSLLTDAYPHASPLEGEQSPSRRRTAARRAA